MDNVTEDYRRTFEEGGAAFQDGQSIDDNPYSQLSPRRSLWYAGYCATEAFDMAWTQAESRAREREEITTRQIVANTTHRIPLKVGGGR